MDTPKLYCLHYTLSSRFLSLGDLTGNLLLKVAFPRPLPILWSVQQYKYLRWFLAPPTFITRIIISFTPWSKYMASRPQKVDKIQGLYKTIIQSMANDGGFKYFLFSSLPGGDDPIWWAHFSNGLVQSPTRWCACAIYWATPGVSFLVLDPCLFGWLATSL